MIVGKHMKTNVITVRPDDPMRLAMDLMKRSRVRQLPVLEGRKVVGIITDRDLREASASTATSLSVWELNYLLDQIKVKELMTRDVITVSPESTVEEAARIIHNRKIGGLPVVEGGDLVGIITEVDLLEVFMNVMGVGKKSTRLEVLVEDEPGFLGEVCQLIKKHEVKILSVASTSADAKGKRINVIRVSPGKAEEICADLDKAGHKVLSCVEKS